MQALSTSALLDAWERGLGRSLAQRALTLLAAACDGEPLDQLARLPLGQRDARLLTLREMTFGPQVNSVARCARCSAQLDLTFDIQQTRAPSPAQEEQTPKDDTFTVACDGCVGRFRLPNSLDLTAIAPERDLARARALLLGRCTLSLTRSDTPEPLDAAPPGLLDAAVERMSRMDAQADVEVTFTCPSCGERREVAFDIASFFWAELDAWAARTILDVHTLATAYGWREAEILAMSSVRRQRYLDLAG